MSLTLEDIERLTKLAALAQQAALEIAKFLANAHAQSGKTTEEILVHAEEANNKAKEAIAAL